MRFRSKFGISGWFSVLVAAVCFYDAAPYQHMRIVDEVLMATWALICLQQILSTVFVYWDLGAAGINEHRFWRRKSVEWHQVTTVKPDIMGFLKIEYMVPGTASKRSQLYAGPVYRKQFLAKVREFAPQAAIDDAPQAELIG